MPFGEAWSGGRGLKLKCHLYHDQCWLYSCDEELSFRQLESGPVVLLGFAWGLDISAATVKLETFRARHLNPELRMLCFYCFPSIYFQISFNPHSSPLPTPPLGPYPQNLILLLSYGLLYRILVSHQKESLNFYTFFFFCTSLRIKKP